MCFYICSMAVVIVALVALWVIGDAAGVISNVEQFIGDLLQTNDFTFLDGEMLRGALLVAAVLVVLLDRDHGDRRRVLQPVRRDLRRRRGHDHRRRVGDLTALGCWYARSPSGAIAQSVRAHP